LLNLNSSQFIAFKSKKVCEGIRISYESQSIVKTPKFHNKANLRVLKETKINEVDHEVEKD